MAYQEQQAEHKRIVIDTPSSRREVSSSETVRYPERNGVSSAALAAIVVGVVVVAAIVILFVMNQQQQDANANVAQAQQPPIVVQQPAPATQPAPVIINGQSAPATTAGGSATTRTGPDDGAIQNTIDKRLNDDPTFSQLGVTASVVGGRVTLM